MRARLLAWWPALPAGLILYLGLTSFLAKYPWAGGRRAVAQAGSGAPDTLMALVLAEADGRRADSAVTDSAGWSDNPFRPVHPLAPVISRPGGGRSKEPPPRNYLLKGTVGSNVATLTNNAGVKLIVKIGDIVDSAQVVTIGPNRVTLKDRAGKFDIFLEN